MAMTGKSRVAKSGKRVRPRAHKAHLKTAELRAQAAPRISSAKVETEPGEHPLVQLSVRVPEPFRRAVHRAALDFGIDVQAFVVSALEAYGIDVGASGPVQHGGRSGGRNGERSGGTPQRRGDIATSSSAAATIDAARVFAVEVIGSLVAALGGTSPGPMVAGTVRGRAAGKQKQSRKGRQS